MAIRAFPCQGLDDRITVGINTLVSHVGALQPLFKYLCNGNISFLVLVCMLLSFWFQGGELAHRQRERVVGGLAAGLVAMFICRVLALGLPFRTRPLAATQLHLVDFHVTDALRTWSSFPSDHSALAFTLAITLWGLSKRAGFVGFLIAVLLVDLPRLAMSLHWASDLVAGALLGTAVSAVFLLTKPSGWVASKVLPLESRSPSLFYGIFFGYLFELVIQFNDLRGFAVALFRAL